MNSIKFKNKVVVRKGKRLYIGTIKRMKFVHEEDLKSLEILDKLKLRYITLFDYVTLLGFDLTKKEVNELRKKIGYTEIWVFDPVLEPSKTSKSISEKRWEKYWFGYVNAKCRNCVNKCKQGSRVELIHCPDYKEVNK